MAASWSSQDQLQKVAGFIRVKSVGRIDCIPREWSGWREVACREPSKEQSVPARAKVWGIRLAWDQIVEGFKCQAKEFIREMK